MRKTASKNTGVNFTSVVTFGSQVGSQRVSVIGGERTPLHAGWRQVPRVRIRLVDV